MRVSTSIITALICIATGNILTNTTPSATLPRVVVVQGAALVYRMAMRVAISALGSIAMTR